MESVSVDQLRRLVGKVRPLDTLPERALYRLGKTSLVQRMIVPFGHDLTPERWIFVVGCYSSGTTLLAKMLQQHPDISGLFSSSFGMV